MYDIAQYQLFKSAQLASPDLESLDYPKLNEQLDIDSYLSDMDQSVLKLSKKKITKAQFNKNTKLLTDRILLTNKGLSKQETLGMIWYQCEKELVVATLLLRRNYNQAGLQLCLSILKRSKKYMFDDINYRASFYALKFAFKLNQKKLYDALKLEFDQFKENKAITDDLENMRRDFFFEHHSAGDLFSEKSLRIIDNALNKYQHLLYNIGSWNIHSIIAQFLLSKYVSKNEHGEAIQLCKDTLEWMNKNAPKCYAVINSLNIRILESYIYTKNYNEGSIFIASLPIRPKYLAHQLLRELFLGIILKFHSAQYHEAYQFYLLLKKKSNPTAVMEDFSNYYVLIEAYIHLLIETRKIKADKLHRFKVHKLINDLPAFAQKKETKNISLIIAKFSFLVIRKKYKDCLQYAIALEKYKQRHLNKSYHKRYKKFIEILIQIPKCGFNKVSVKRKTAQSLSELNTLQTDSIYVTYLLEMIPYEILWEMLSESLSDRHYFYEEEAEVRAERAKLLKAI